MTVEQRLTSIQGEQETICKDLVELLHWELSKFMKKTDGKNDTTSVETRLSILEEQTLKLHDTVLLALELNGTFKQLNHVLLNSNNERGMYF
jgi:hypothetical protein